MNLPNPADVLEARTRVAGHVVRTPMLRSPWLDKQTGGTVLIKAEPLQRTGSFKLRGATNALLLLPAAQRPCGVVTFSSGNHGQAIACAAASLGMRATIVMPADAPAIKRDATARWGAEIISYDRKTEDREAIGQAIVARTGACLIPPYDHPAVIAGQGTLGLELAEDAKAAGLSLESLLVCTGGGGLIAGCALALEAASPATRIFAVEPAGSDDTARSLAAGERLMNDGTGSGFCDALLSPMPGVLTFEINRRRLAGALTVTDDEVLRAMAWALTHLKLVVEPGGAVALAAVLAGKFPMSGSVTGIVLSGGNADPAVLERCLRMK
jgi:threonine dehydratase